MTTGPEHYDHFVTRQVDRVDRSRELERFRRRRRWWALSAVVVMMVVAVLLIAGELL